MPCKPQRIRDPLHNLIEFGTDQFEDVLWRVVQTPQFQRLRRIRQLGFSEFVYPGATHTRFAHSVGVFHTARRLAEIIKEKFGDGELETQRKVALAAALVHDIGHGMFSHTFEEVGKKLRLGVAGHEVISARLIRDSDISALFSELGSGFANDVANVIERGSPGNLYDAIVSSQFDADRLDYMQRDRLMSGVQNSGIDFVWLMANLEIGEVPVGADEQQAGTIKTFVLGPKAIHAAETYVLALFQLYPTIYFHKATRAAEKTFSALMIRLISLTRDGHVKKTGLSENHPICNFAREPDLLPHMEALDDSVFWGALPMLLEAEDVAVRKLARRLRNRNLHKAIDIREQLVAELILAANVPVDERKEVMNKIKQIGIRIEEEIIDWSEKTSKDEPRVLTDRASRAGYKELQDSKGPLNQIRIRAGTKILDVSEISPVVGGAEYFDLFRIYVDGVDEEAREKVESIKKNVIKEIM